MSTSPGFEYVDCSVCKIEHNIKIKKSKLM